MEKNITTSTQIIPFKIQHYTNRKIAQIPQRLLNQAGFTTDTEAYALVGELPNGKHCIIVLVEKEDWW